MSYMDKIKGLMGLNNDEEEYDGEDEVQDEVQDEKPEQGPRSLPAFSGTRNNGPAPKNTMKVVIKEPKVFQDVYDIADELTHGRQVIINLEGCKKEQGQRIIDFISGTVHAITGQGKQVGKYIFVFTPKTMEISNQDPMKEHRRPQGADYNPNGYTVENPYDGE